MNFHFDSSQEYQLAAIKSVVDVFEGQPLSQSDFETSLDYVNSSIQLTEKGIGNKLILNEEQILNNIQSIQKRNGISVSDTLISSYSENHEVRFNNLNFTIEMETGTGKTYTYLRSIYELNNVYGFKKFVIVVPNIAIREGNIKNLEITHEHFQALYNNPSINFTMYDSKNLSTLRNFSISNSIEILVINIDSFTKDNNVINTIRESGVKPIEYIQATFPIIIIDGPQNMETDVRKAAIYNLNPLCTLRYSATHKNQYNLLYSLNPVEAYDLGLVKQIEVDGITVTEDFNAAFIRVIGFEQNKKSLRARIVINIQLLFEVKEKIVSVVPGDDLYNLSGGREIYKNGYIINSINVTNDNVTVEFSNGLVLSQYEEIGKKTDEVLKYQIERALFHHFEKEVKYWKGVGNYEPVKVLTLFFIDKVENYRKYDEAGNAAKGKFAIWFEEIFEKFVAKYQPLYADLFNAAPRDSFFYSTDVHNTDIPFLKQGYWNPNKVHNGYFSKDKRGNFRDTKGNTKDDEDTYSLIMRDKERLLSLEEPLRFIFSHSALREGWDSPNVFQICTLNESKSEIKKRQEIGRGLRLAVDSRGNRINDKRINVLTIIANETYENFSKALQKEVQDETNTLFANKIKNARDKTQIKSTKELTIENFPLLFEIWNRISHKTRYKVEYNSDELIKRTVAELKDFNKVPLTKRPSLEAKKAKLFYTSTGIEADLLISKFKQTEFVNYQIPDVYNYVQSKVEVTRKTIFEILKQSDRYEEIEINPQLFLDNMINTIKSVLSILLVEGLKYEQINGQHYQLSLLQNEEIETYLSNLFKVTRYDKTLFNYIPIDSSIECDFARDCEADENVKFFFKLPKGFKIPTPIGNYTPDWAVVFENTHKIYFVVENKSTFDRALLHGIERLKIECGEKYFALLKKENVEYKIAIDIKSLH